MPRPARVRLALLAAVLAIGAGAAAYLWWPGGDSHDDAGPADPPGGPPPDPRLTYETPYRNVRPQVAFVGDAACLPCHKDLCDSYHRHPMGRSATTAPARDRVEAFDPAHPPRFTALGNTDLRVAGRGDTYVHAEAVRAPGGRVVSEIEADVALAIGSGTRGRAYVCVRDGALWQSGISWYSEKQLWSTSDNRHAIRPIVAGCLFCHVDRVEPVAGAVNRYKEPLVGAQAAIGCERCHGPGSLHVAERTDGLGPTGDLDPTIVNPRRLSAALREDVCRQCHLQGAERVARRGRDLFEFRPGLPLELFLTVHVRHPALTDYRRSVGQVEQMAVSRCGTASGGQLGCTSCHDPHYAPAAAEKPGHYRARCLACHQEKGCSEAPASRQAAADACTACHMPKTASTSVVHVSVTDHRIPRRTAGGPAEKKSLPPGELPLVAFAPPGPGGPAAAERERDLGIALSRQPGRNPTVLAEALKRLRPATERHADDAEAWQALAVTLLGQGEWTESLRAAEAAVAAGPDREPALALAADTALKARRLDRARQYAARAVAVNPGEPMHRLRLAESLAEAEEFPAAEAELRALLDRTPNHAEARAALAVALHQQGRARDGLAELDRALALDPRQADQLRAWYTARTR